jgi:dolichol-phosphate mannosyltransferase
MIQVSIVVSVRNDAERIEPFAEEISTVMNRHPWSWECIWADDHSEDETLSILRSIARSDSHHHYLSFVRRFGTSAAFLAGFRKARGAVLVTLDGEGRSDPADVPLLVARVLSGEADLACGYREDRSDSWSCRTSARIAAGFRNRIAGRTLRDPGCSARAFTRDSVRNLPPIAGIHRYFPTLLTIQGFRIEDIPVRHRPRPHGKPRSAMRSSPVSTLMDLLCIWWMRKRALHYSIAVES